MFTSREAFRRLRTLSNPVATAVILAAGRGIRLGERTREMPKSFLEVGGERLIERSIRLLQEQGIEEIVIGVGHAAEAFDEMRAKFGVTLYKSDAYETTNSLYTLACGRSHLKGDMLILESDLLYHGSALARILACPQRDVILGSGFTDAGDEVYLHTRENDQFRFLTKDASDRANAYAELVGISKVSAELYEKMIKLPTVREIPYEYAFSELSRTVEIHVERYADLVWCEIDDEDHLRRAIDEVWPRLCGE